MADIQIFDSDGATPIVENPKDEICDVNGNVITYKNIKHTIDKGLIQRAIDGDKSAFNELYMQSYRYVFFITRQYIADDETTYDAIQETFIKVYKGINNLQTTDAFYGWISTIAKNTAIDILRTSRYEKTIEYQENCEKLMQNEKNHDVLLDVQAVLKKLDPQDTELLSLVYYDGMRVSQIAKIQGVPATTVYSRFNKAKKNLKAQLNAHGIDKAIYSGNFMAMVATAIRNIIGTALLSFVIAQQILNSIIGKQGKKELAVANIIKKHQKNIILKIASVIVALSMITTIFTVVLLKMVDKYFDENSYDLQISVESNETSTSNESSYQIEYDENKIEGNTSYTDEKLDEHPNTVTDTSEKNNHFQSSEEDTSIIESTLKEDEPSDTITVPNVFGNTANNVMWFYEDSFSPIGCPIAKNSDYIYYSDNENIFKVNSDDAKKTVIYSSEESSPLCYDLNLVGDYLYFIDGGIKRIKTDGSELKTIYSDDAFNLLVRGNTGWFVVLDNPTYTAMFTKYDLFQIDLQTGQTTKLIDNASGLGLKIVLQDELIYVNGDTVYRKNLSTGLQEQLYKIQNTEDSYYVGFEKMCINGNDIYILEKNLSYESRETKIVKINLNAPDETYVYDEESGYSIYDMFGYINGYGLLIAYNSSTGANSAVITIDGMKQCETSMCKIFMFESDDYVYTYDTENKTIQRELPDGSNKQMF